MGSNIPTEIECRTHNKRYARAARASSEGLVPAYRQAGLIAAERRQYGRINKNPINQSRRAATQNRHTKSNH